MQEHQEAANNSIYSIIKDYKDLAMEAPKRTKLLDVNPNLQNHDALLTDISNIMPTQQPKRNTSICFTAESSKDGERPTKKNSGVNIEATASQRLAGFSQVSPSTTLQMPPLSPQPASKLRHMQKSSDTSLVGKSSPSYPLKQREPSNPYDLRPHEFINPNHYDKPEAARSNRNALDFEDDPIIIPPTPIHSNQRSAGHKVEQEEASLDKTQLGEHRRVKNMGKEPFVVNSNASRKLVTLKDNEEYKIHDLQVDLVKTSNFGGPYPSTKSHASSKSKELNTYSGYEQVYQQRGPTKFHPVYEQPARSTSKVKNAPAHQEIKRAASRSNLLQPDSNKENIQNGNRKSNNSYVFIRSKSGRILDQSKADSRKADSTSFTNNSSSYACLPGGFRENRSLESEQGQFCLGSSDAANNGDFQFRLGPSTGSMHGPSTQKHQVQEIHRHEIESPTQEDCPDYIPQALRKKKQHGHVLAKVDHRRDRSRSRLNGQTSAQSILDKQYNVARVDSFENVMSNLRGGAVGRSLYEDHFKKGFLN